VLEPVNEVRASLSAAGHMVVRVPVQTDLAWFDAVREVDAVFNLCEGVGGVSYRECNVAAALELARVPFTGGGFWMMTVCHQKPLLNALLQASGLPVPAWHVPTEGRPVPDDFPIPAIVKPAEEDASVGIDQQAVVASREALDARVARMQEEFGEVMVQRYVSGREMAVAFVGEHTLPLSEIDFSDLDEGLWRIVSYDAKWTPGTPDDRGTQPVCPAQVDKQLERKILAVATAAWEAVDGWGYGRVDLRVDDDGNPWILEVNPNPDISTDAGLVRMARAYGWPHDELIRRIVAAAFVNGHAVPDRVRREIVAQAAEPAA
jgi:D-alanine-D-alanine ligase